MPVRWATSCIRCMCVCVLVNPDSRGCSSARSVAALIQLTSLPLPHPPACLHSAPGDGAGVGKGRQISGIVLDNYARGRRKSVWISTSTGEKKGW